MACLQAADLDSNQRMLLTPPPQFKTESEVGRTDLTLHLTGGCFHFNGKVPILILSKV